jgi:hypothetical protein
MAIGLVATAIAVILLASNVTIANAQQLTSQLSEMEIRTIAESTKDSFRVQIPEGWVIQDVNNTGSALVSEVLEGYGILAQLCPDQEEGQAAALSNATDYSNRSSSSSNNNNSCRGAQEEVIHIIRYPNVGAKLGFASADIITNDDITTNAIVAYQMQMLQEAGYRDIRIVDSTDTVLNVDNSTGMGDNNSTIAATVPAKHVEMTYSTNLAPNETRTGYFISAATDATPRNLGMITGYGIFYEGSSNTAYTTISAEEGTTPTPVREVFDSFEFIAGREVVQGIAQTTTEGEEEAAATNTTTTTEGEGEGELTNPLTVEIA